MNTTEFLAIASAIVPDRTAIIFDDKTTTFQDLESRANQLANALAAAGVQPGDRVGIMAVNSNFPLEVYFAAAKLDAVFVPYSFRAKADELAFLLSNSAPRVLFTDHRYVSMVDSLGDKVQLEQIVRVDLDGPASPGWAQHAGFVAGHSPEPLHSPSAPDSATTVLMYTSGTTGTPKGVMLSHDTFSSYVLGNVSPVDPDVEERNLLSVPFNHIAGLQAALAAVFGGRTLIMERQFEPVEWMRLVEQYGANRAMLVPTMLKQLIDHPDFRVERLASLKSITYGASPMPLEVLLKALDMLPHVEFINAFGQTEGGGTLTMLSPEDHRFPPGLSAEERARRLKRLTSIGKPLPDIELAIVDEYGNQVGSGTVGEIAAQGPRVMKGYAGRDADTASTIRGGWLFTGDLGYQDEDGYVFITGRAKDFFKRGGEMVSPRKIEEILLGHPSIDDVAVVGLSHPQWVEAGLAVVVLRQGVTPPTLDELKAYAAARLPAHERPEDYVFVPELPRNQMGKVLKPQLREQYRNAFS